MKIAPLSLILCIILIKYYEILTLFKLSVHHIYSNIVFIFFISQPFLSFDQILCHGINHILQDTNCSEFLDQSHYSIRLHYFLLFPYYFGTCGTGLTNYD